MPYYFAPLEGITTAVYRRAHAAVFGGADRYYTPFVSPTSEHCFTRRQLRELSPAENAGLPVVPQLLTKNAADFSWAAAQLAEMGYRQLDLNAGCPSGTVVAKGKGSGLLTDPDTLDAFLDAIFNTAAKTPGSLPISVKTRLGRRSVDEMYKIVEVYNRYPICELTIHPRVQKDYYRVPIHGDAFAAVLPLCSMPVCYNGDLVTPAACSEIERRYPALSAVMLGRAPIADPAFFRRMKGGAALKKNELRRFSELLLQGYRAAYSDDFTALMRLRDVWSFQIWMFEDSEPYMKKLRRMSDIPSYEAILDRLFAECELRAEPLAHWLAAAPV